MILNLGMRFCDFCLSFPPLSEELILFCWHFFLAIRRVSLGEDLWNVTSFCRQFLSPAGHLMFQLEVGPSPSLRNVYVCKCVDSEGVTIWQIFFHTKNWKTTPKSLEFVGNFNFVILKKNGHWQEEVTPMGETVNQQETRPHVSPPRTTVHWLRVLWTAEWQSRSWLLFYGVWSAKSDKIGLLGNTSTQSGSIFQPAMLDDPGV